MNIGFWLIIIGLVACAALYGLNALFVDKSDEENPYRRLAAAMGYGGLISIGWGVVLLLFYDS